MQKINSIDQILNEILDEFESYDVVESIESHDSNVECFLFSSPKKDLLIDPIVTWIDSREFRLLENEDLLKFEIFSKESTEQDVRQFLTIGSEEDFLKS